MQEEAKIPNKIPACEQEVFLVIARDGQIVDLRVVGDGLLGQLLKAASKRDDGIVKELPVHPRASSPGYRAYAMSATVDEGFESYGHSIKSLKLAMNLITPGEYTEIEEILEDMGSAQPGDIVQFYGCF